MQRIDSCAAEWRDGCSPDREHAMNRDCRSDRNDDCIGSRRDGWNLRARSSDRMQRRRAGSLMDVCSRPRAEYRQSRRDIGLVDMCGDSCRDEVQNRRGVAVPAVFCASCGDRRQHCRSSRKHVVSVRCDNRRQGRCPVCNRQMDNTSSDWRQINIYVSNRMRRDNEINLVTCRRRVRKILEPEINSVSGWWGVGHGRLPHQTPTTRSNTCTASAELLPSARPRLLNDAGGVKFDVIPAATDNFTRKSCKYPFM